VCTLAPTITSNLLAMGGAISSGRACELDKNLICLLQLTPKCFEINYCAVYASPVKTIQELLDN